MKIHSSCTGRTSGNSTSSHAPLNCLSVCHPVLKSSPTAFEGLYPQGGSGKNEEVTILGLYESSAQFGFASGCGPSAASNRIDGSAEPSLRPTIHAEPIIPACRIKLLRSIIVPSLPGNELPARLRTAPAVLEDNLNQPFLSMIRMRHTYRLRQRRQVLRPDGDLWHPQHRLERTLAAVAAQPTERTDAVTHPRVAPTRRGRPFHGLPV